MSPQKSCIEVFTPSASEGDLTRSRVIADVVEKRLYWSRPGS